MITRPKSVALAFLAGAVLVGALLGFTADRLVLGEQPCDRRVEAKRMRDRLASDIDLSAAQRTVFDSVLDARNLRMRTLYESLRPSADSLYADSHDAIRRMLAPDQRARYEEFVQRANARMEKR